MAASIDDFVRRLTRSSRKFTFLFSEDFFAIEGQTGVQTDRYMKIRNLIRNMHHHKGTQAALRAKDEEALFDVRVVIVHRTGCFTTSFQELATGPFGDEAIICGYGSDMVDAQKARFLVEGFFADQRENHSQTVMAMLADQRNRQVVLIAESPADLKRPSLEPVRKLRNRLATILVNPVKGPIVDCQVMAIFQEGNSNTLSALLNNFCVRY
ncbi:MAG: hypothetical protein FWH27_12860 [Planctomycetaceae bacterium]|nr:hypothetical protein [Planctomycetaceae bacterium]